MTTPEVEISPAEVWLKEVVLLAHQGNRAAALQRLNDLFPLLFPNDNGDVRGTMRNVQSDPMTIPIAELDLGPGGMRIVQQLERWLGAIYVGDLQKWKNEDFERIPMFGPVSLERLRTAVRKVVAR